MPRINFDNKIKSRTWVILLVAVLLASSAVLQLNIVAAKGATVPTTLAANVPVAGGPTGVAFDSGNNMLYVTDSSGNVSVLTDANLSTSSACYPSCGTLVASIKLAGSASPTSIVADPTDSEVFVSDTHNNKVHVISTTSNTDVKQIALTGTPEGIAWDSANDMVYVGNSAGGLNGISPTTNAVVSTISLSGTPSGVAVDTTFSAVFVALSNVGKVVSVNTTTNLVNKTITVKTNPQGAAFDSSSNTIYVADQGSGQVSVINAKTDKVSTVTVGSSPSGVAYDVTVKDVYVSNNGANTISVLSGTKVKNTIVVQSSPKGVAFDSKNNQVDVANSASNTLSVISTAYLNYVGPSTLPSGSINETGSTLLQPMIGSWTTGFDTVYTHVGVFNSGGGSGEGQLAIETGWQGGIVGTVQEQLGGSDAYQNSSTFHTTYPEILEIPVAVSAQQINYNVPGIPQSMNLNLSGTILTDIYNGTITVWNDSRIQAANPGAVNAGDQTLLPYQNITVFRRGEATGSGDTFIFTQYLALSDPWWASNVGYGTLVTWPSAPHNQTAIGNSGMVSGIQATPYSIGYVGISFLNTAETDGLGFAFLQNQAGNYVNITSANIQAAVNAKLPFVPADEQISLEYAPGATSYPIVNFEYVFVRDNQSSATEALLIRTFLSWCIATNDGQQGLYLNLQHFVALPNSVIVLSQTQIAEIGPY